MKKLIIYILFPIILSGSIVLAQDKEVDTLYLFPDTTTFVNHSGTYVDDVTNLGIKLNCDSTREYKIEKIIVLIAGSTQDTVLRTVGYRISLGQAPEDSVLYESTFKYRTQFPLWQTVEIGSNVKITNSKCFFITGFFLFVVARSEFTWNEFKRDQFLYRIGRWSDGAPFYYAIKVVVSSQPTGIKNNSGQNITTYRLFQNYPNPFNSDTQIRYFIPSDDYVQVEVIDLLGRVVKILYNGYQKPGEHTIHINANGLSGGIYFIRMHTNLFSDIKKAVYLK